jgi:hypothetical protein
MTTRKTRATATATTWLGFVVPTLDDVGLHQGWGSHFGLKAGEGKGKIDSN